MTFKSDSSDAMGIPIQEFISSTFRDGESILNFFSEYSVDPFPEETIGKVTVTPYQGYPEADAGYQQVAPSRLQMPKQGVQRHHPAPI
ncbi:hypothetical protein CEXT_179251 [Caerostris extrusa]|uniref:Uncharacterized protein n=1 Tax=Caerostris extrusa TaxID=172846 RepID=A0AAV4QXM6_CAEEX|nr:hypothetical protein CEXT_179251 [Caerostris extrusa]